ncbi:unnamed protein product [Phytophthora lilii]|uniref:Unnamed protein product n=1 Tax=Phytophthora lilii TaxID=2077276 RepID=A0A9W6YKG2_9STRA|nr:unnamed protein product [Phytophthora lilii]
MIHRSTPDDQDRYEVLVSMEGNSEQLAAQELGDNETKVSATLQPTLDNSTITESNESSDSSTARRGAMQGSSEDAGFVSDSEPLSQTAKDSSLPLSHRAVDALRQSPVVEMHRSSSGRNLRLKHLSLADGALLSAPNALTPRAPSGRRPESRQRLYSADCNQSTNNRGVGNNDNLLQRSSSFLISAHVLKDFERVRSATDPEGLAELCEKPEQPSRCSEDEDQQQREESSDESEEIHWDAHDDISHINSEAHDHADPGALDEDNKSVSNFGLWGRAAKSKRMPDAIIFSGSSAEEIKPAHIRSSSESSSSIPTAEIKSSRYTQPDGIPTASEMVSQLYVAHPHLVALSALDIPKSMSLTRSTSPRIGRSTFSSLPDTSLRRASVAPVNNQQVDAERETFSDFEGSNPITQWKKGELIGEGTFGKVYKGLNIATGEFFALKEIEIHSSPNADQVTQMQKLGEEIALMNNLSQKHIVRSAKNISGHACSRKVLANVLLCFCIQLQRKPPIFVYFLALPGANVLVNEQGVSKLADFGCSKQIPQMLTTSLEESLRSIRGSIPWMAPEVVKQTGHGYKADIWSIGATVIEMATAKHPWPNCHNGLAAMYSIAMATSPPPLPEHLSAEAKSFLRRCFCIDPEGMFNSA